MSAYQQKDAGGWMPVTCLGPHNEHDFPLWLFYPSLGAGSISLWRTKSEMELFGAPVGLATHWKPAKDDIPSPPGGLGTVSLRKRSEGEARAYVEGYNSAVRMCRERLFGIIELK